MNYSLPSYFLVFLPLTALAYQLTPQRRRWTVLLLASWFFFWSISGKLLLYLIVSSSSIHHFGLWMDCVMEEGRGAVKGLPRSARKVVKARYQSRLFHIVVLGAGAQLGVLCYTCQLYMEFSGVMDMVIGTAELFGVTLPKIFRLPFFSHTVSEFWHRWHSTLGAWFRDYVFYPVSLTEPMKNLSKFGRKKLGNRLGTMLASGAALFCVWFFNGLWHGAAWHYLFFGMYHFVVILLEQIAQPLFAPLLSRTRLGGKSQGRYAFQLLRTFLLVNLGELFFRANSLRDGLSMAYGLFTRFTLRSIWNGSVLNLGLDAYDYTVCLLSIAAVLGVSVLHERGVSLRRELALWNTAPRWAAYWAVLLVIILFGAYGMNYAPVDPIYAKF